MHVESRKSKIQFFSERKKPEIRICLFFQKKKKINLKEDELKTNKHSLAFSNRCFFNILTEIGDDAICLHLLYLGTYFAAISQIVTFFRTEDIFSRTIWSCYTASSETGLRVWHKPLFRATLLYSFTLLLEANHS